MLRIIVEGEASLYGWGGYVKLQTKHMDNITNPIYEKTTTTTQIMNISEIVELFFKGKNVPYSYNIS